MRIKPIGVAEGDGAGTTAYSTDNIILYTPTQAETNYTSFILIAKKTGCIPVSVTVVTTASGTPGVAWADVRQLLGTAWLTPAVAGTPDVNTKLAGGTAWGSGAITAGSIAASALNGKGDWSLASVWTSTRGGYIDLIPNISTATVFATGTVNDASATTTSFVTDLTSSVDDFYVDALLTFTGASSPLLGQSRPILSYNGTTKAVTVSEAFTSAPLNGSAFTVKIEHIHPVTQIASGVRTELATELARIDVATSTRSTLTQTQVTGGAYALNHASFAFNAGLDFTNAQKAATLARVTLTDTVTTYTGNTPQTGDSYAIVNSGTHGNAAIKGYVDDIGTAGAGLTAVPWNAAWDAEVQSEVEDAIVVHRLDELLNADSDIDGAAPPTVGSVFHELMSKTTGSFTFDQTTDSNEALRDRGDAAWTTATGFSTLDASGVRTAVGLASANLDTQLADLPTVAEFEARTIVAANYSTASALSSLVTTVGAAGAGLTEAGGTGDHLTALPWNAAWDAEVQSEVTDALTTALTEAYRTAGSTGSVAQLLYEISAHLGRAAIASTIKTLKKVDNSTTAQIYTLDSATTPTAVSGPN